MTFSPLVEGLHWFYTVCSNFLKFFSTPLLIHHLSTMRDCTSSENSLQTVASAVGWNEEDVKIRQKKLVVFWGSIRIIPLMTDVSLWKKKSYCDLSILSSHMTHCKKKKVRAQVIPSSSDPHPKTFLFVLCFKFITYCYHLKVENLPRYLSCLPSKKHAILAGACRLFTSSILYIVDTMITLSANE